MEQEVELMSRQPKQIHVYLYRKTQSGYEYAIFQRRDNPLWWQGICGGVEDEETFEEAAIRETYEEAGITDKLPLYRLDNVSYLPVSIFNERTQRIWGSDVVVVPMYFFAIPFYGEVMLSPEHTEVRWLDYANAHKLVYFLDQQTALYELNERLMRGNLFR